MKRVPLNIVAALIVLMIVAMIFFGWIVMETERGVRDMGKIGRLFRDLAKIPASIKHAFVETASHPGLALEQRFGTVAGFKQIDPDFVDDGYLLLSRVNGDLDSPQVELLRISDNKVLHTWRPDIDHINSLSKLKSRFVKLARDKHSGRYRMVHPFLTNDGGLIFQDDSPLVKINVCSEPEWTIDGVFHHGLERAADGNYWIPGTIEPSSLDNKLLKRHRDDSIVQVSPEGEILFNKSVAQILIDNDHQGVVYGVAPYESDILHLNEVQPALFDGSLWKRGDLLISLRYRSMVFLYRPSSNKILWMSIGPWLNQHDPDFLNPEEISVFSNESYRPVMKGAQKMFNAHNEVYIMNLSSQSVRKPYTAGLKKFELRTISEGRARILGNRDVYIEESNHGRLLRLSESGDLRWQFINRASDGKTYKLGWTRYLSNADLLPVINRLNTVNCGDK